MNQFLTVFFGLGEAVRTHFEWVLLDKYKYVKRKPPMSSSIPNAERFGGFRVFAELRDFLRLPG